MKKSCFHRFAAILMMAAALALSVGCSQIDTGNVGVSKLGGKINPDEVAPGWTLTGLSSVDEYTTKEVLFAFTNLTPKSRDGMTMADVDVDVYIKPEPGKVAETVSKYQGDVGRHGDIDKDSKNPSDLVAGPSKVSREAREAIRNGVALFDATTMHTKLPDVADAIRVGLQKELDKTDKGTWTVVGVNLRSLVTDRSIEDSIRKKLATDQEIEQKNKQIELAKSEAKRLEAQALGEARANDIISASLTDKLIRLKELEAQKAFAGAGTHTVLMGQGSGTLVNVGK